MQCAKLNANGCARDCCNCMYNIHNYVNDVREASFLKANAYSNYHRQNVVVKYCKDRVKAASLAGPVVVIILVLVCIWGRSSIKNYITPSKAEVIQETEYFLVNTSWTASDISKIQSVLRRMPSAVYDVNRDGMINCIDYAIIFRRLHGHDAYIVHNINPHTGMNHLFIQVRIGLDVYDVEPSGTPDRWSMSSVWGMRYNPYFNQDVTSQWGM